MRAPTGSICKHPSSDIERLQDDNRALRANLATATEALKFYGDPDHYRTVEGLKRFIVDDDVGAIARAALEKLERE